MEQDLPTHRTVLEAIDRFWFILMVSPPNYPRLKNQTDSNQREKESSGARQWDSLRPLFKRNGHRTILLLNRNSVT